ncbi:MAG: outer membrane protein transport protein [Byssovorax sp.]
MARAFSPARALALGAALASAALALPARANEADAYGLGSRSAALGGAVAADVTDFSANYYNPAALAGAKGPSLSVGYAFASNNLRTNGQDNNVANVHGIVGGLVVPGTIFKIPFAFGIGTFMPDAGLSRIKALRQETPRWALYDERASIIFLSTSLAVRPLPWLEVGGGVTFLAATKGTFAISGVANLISPTSSQLRHEVDADLTSVRYPQLGARVKVLDLGTIGVTYRGETKIKLALDANLAGNIDFAGALIPLTYNLSSRIVDAFLPQQVVLGFSFQKIARLKVNLDFTFVNWAAYESPTADTIAHLGVSLPPGSKLQLPEDPKRVTVIPPAFENRLVPRLGVEYLVPGAGKLREVHGESRRLIEIPIRAGYVYERSPVPPQTGLTNFVDADRHTLSAGTGLVLNAPSTILPGSLALDVHGQLSILPERVILKDSPADFIGDYRASGTMLGAGATLTAVF